MKPPIIEITEWYNSKGQLIGHTIAYETGREYGSFEQMPKATEKWLERVKKSAKYIVESKNRDWTCKVYRKEVE